MIPQFHGTTEDVGSAIYGIENITDIELAEKVWEGVHHVRGVPSVCDTPAESYLKGAPLFGSSSPFHNGIPSVSWYEGVVSMWSCILTDTETIAYHPECLVNGCVVPAIVLRYQDLNTKQFTGVTATHIDPLTGGLGGAGRVTYGDISNSICPITPLGLHDHLIVGVGFENTLQILADKSARCGCIVPQARAILKLGNILPSSITKVTVVVGDNEDDIHDGKNLAETLLGKGVDVEIITRTNKTQKNTHAGSAGVKVTYNA